MTPMTPFLAHSTPFRSHRSLSKVSTNSGEAHVAAQHIDEPRERFKPGVSQESANLSRLASPDRDGVFRMGDHGAELQHLKTVPTPTDAGLPLEDRPGSLPFDGQRDKKHQRQGRYEQDASNYQVGRTPHLIQR